MDLKKYKIFAKLITYEGARDFETLKENYIIKRIDHKIAERIINSIICPNSDSIKLYNSTLSKSTIENIVNLVFNLNFKLSYVYNYRNVIFISVLRSGHFLAKLLKYLIYRLYKINIKIICISPNYIENIDSSFTRYINSSSEDFIFIDGWMSRGTTYSILKKFWQKQKIKKNFKMAVLSNISSYNNSDIISSTNEDILIPWSICQTDNLGLSNFFIYKKNKKPTTFFIPKNNRVVKDPMGQFTKLIDKRIEDKYYDPNIYIFNIKNKINTHVVMNTESRFIKFGINECIKSIDKHDVKCVYISNKLRDFDFSILKKYCIANNLKFKRTNEKHSYIVKECTQ